MKREARTDIRLAVVATLVLAAIAIAGGAEMRSWPLVGVFVNSCNEVEAPGARLTPRAAAPSCATAGSVWYDSSKGNVGYRTALGNASAAMLVAPAVTDSDTLANPTTSTTFSGVYTIPSATLTAGKVLRLIAWGRYTTGATALPTLSLATHVNGAVVASSGAISVATGLTNKAWLIRTTIIVRSVGASGSIVALTESAAGGLLAAAVPTDAIERAGATTVNTTGQVTLAPAALFGVSDASNAITNEGFLVEILN